MGVPQTSRFCSSGNKRTLSVPPHPQRYYGAGDLHFVTFSCYRRLPLLGLARRRDLFLRALEAVRRQYRLVVAGYVVMPEHVHLLVGEPEQRDLSVALKALKQSVARRALAQLRRRNRAQAAQTSNPGSSGAPPSYPGHPPAITAKVIDKEHPEDQIHNPWPWK